MLHIKRYARDLCLILYLNCKFEAPSEREIMMDINVFFEARGTARVNTLTLDL